MAQRSANFVEKIYVAEMNGSIFVALLYCLTEGTLQQGISYFMGALQTVGMLLFLAVLLRALSKEPQAEVALPVRLKTLALGTLPPLLLWAVLTPLSVGAVFLGGSLVMFFLGPAAPLISGLSALVVLAIWLVGVVNLLLPIAVSGILLLHRDYQAGTISRAVAVAFGILLCVPLINVIAALMLLRICHNNC